MGCPTNTTLAHVLARQIFDHCECVTPDSFRRVGSRSAKVTEDLREVLEIGKRPLLR
jgi:hypothetical protein